MEESDTDRGTMLESTFPVQNRMVVSLHREVVIPLFDRLYCHRSCLGQYSQGPGIGLENLPERIVEHVAYSDVSCRSGRSVLAESQGRLWFCP